MSLIIYTTNNGFPVLIGDLLISATDNIYNAEIPVYMKSFPEFQTKQNLFPETLKQKIYIINDQMALGMAGYLDEMKNLLQDVKNFFKYYDTNYENIEIFWEQYNKYDFKRSACVFLVGEKELDKTVIKSKKVGNWNYGFNKEFGDVFSFGSGSETILDELEEIKYSPSNNRERIALHTIAICRLIGSEYFSGHSIINSWGGGYELIFYDGKKFTKIDDTCYLIWNCKFDEKGNYDLEPRIALNYKYFENIFIITVNNFYSAKQYGITAIGFNKNEINLDNVPSEYTFSSKRIACCCRIELPDGNFSISAFYLEADSGTLDNLLSISILKSGHSQIIIHKNLENKIHESILIDKENYFGT